MNLTKRVTFICSILCTAGILYPAAASSAILTPLVSIDIKLAIPYTAEQPVVVSTAVLSDPSSSSSSPSLPVPAVGAGAPTISGFTGQEWVRKHFSGNKNFIDYLERERLKGDIVNTVYAPFYNPNVQNAFEQLLKKAASAVWEPGTGRAIDGDAELKVLEAAGFIFLPPIIRWGQAPEIIYNVVKHKDFPDHLIKLSKIFDNDVWWGGPKLSDKTACTRGFLRNIGRIAIRKRVEAMARQHNITSITFVDEHVVVAPRPIPALFAAIVISKELSSISSTQHTFSELKDNRRNPIRFLNQCNINTDARNLLHLTDGSVAPVDMELDRVQWKEFLANPKVFSSSNIPLRILPDQQFTDICRDAIARLETTPPNSTTDVAVFETVGPCIYSSDAWYVVGPMRAYYDACKAKGLKCIFLVLSKNTTESDQPAWHTTLQRAGFTGYEKIIFLPESMREILSGESSETHMEQWVDAQKKELISQGHTIYSMVRNNHTRQLSNADFAFEVLYSSTQDLMNPISRRFAHFPGKPICQFTLDDPSTFSFLPPPEPTEAPERISASSSSSHRHTVAVTHSAMASAPKISATKEFQKVCNDAIALIKQTPQNTNNAAVFDVNVLFVWDGKQQCVIPPALEVIKACVEHKITPYFIAREGQGRTKVYKQTIKEIGFDLLEGQLACFDDDTYATDVDAWERKIYDKWRGKTFIFRLSSSTAALTKPTPSCASVKPSIAPGLPAVPAAAPLPKPSYSITGKHVGLAVAAATFVVLYRYRHVIFKRFIPIMRRA